MLASNVTSGFFATPHQFSSNITIKKIDLILIKTYNHEKQPVGETAHLPNSGWSIKWVLLFSLTTFPGSYVLQII